MKEFTSTSTPDITISDSAPDFTVSDSASELTLGGGRKLWQNLKASFLQRKLGGSFSYSLMAPPPPPPKELKSIQNLFEPSMTSGNERESFSHYSYPFTGLEAAHKTLAPNVIPTILAQGRPLELFPIKSENGELQPEDFEKFLEEATVSEVINEEDTKQVHLLVSNGTHNFSIPVIYIDDLGWRIDNCVLVEAIIDNIALKSKR